MRIKAYINEQDNGVTLRFNEEEKFTAFYEMSIDETMELCDRLALLHETLLDETRDKAHRCAACGLIGIIGETLWYADEYDCSLYCEDCV